MRPPLLLTALMLLSCRDAPPPSPPPEDPCATACQRGRRFEREELTRRREHMDPALAADLDAHLASKARLTTCLARCSAEELDLACAKRAKTHAAFLRCYAGPVVNDRGSLRKEGEGGRRR